MERLVVLASRSMLRSSLRCAVLASLAVAAGGCSALAEPQELRIASDTLAAFPKPTPAVTATVTGPAKGAPVLRPQNGDGPHSGG